MAGGHRTTVTVNGRTAPPASIVEVTSASAPGPEAAAASVSLSEMVPQAASVVEVDLSPVARRLEADRAAWLQRGIEPSFTPYFAAALLAAVRQVPQANAAFDAEARGIRRYPAVHLGLSLATAHATPSCPAGVSQAAT